MSIDDSIAALIVAVGGASIVGLSAMWIFGSGRTRLHASDEKNPFRRNNTDENDENADEGTEQPDYSAYVTGNVRDFYQVSGGYSGRILVHEGDTMDFYVHDEIGNTHLEDAIVPIVLAQSREGQEITLAGEIDTDTGMLDVYEIKYASAKNPGIQKSIPSSG